MKHDKLKHMLSKKRNLSDHEKHAKMDVLGHLKDMATEAMGDKLGGMKKVSVASNSPEGLQHGLEKAKQIVSSPEMTGMVNHAENPYGDYEEAMQEHEGEAMSEGGEVETPDKGDYSDVDQEAPTSQEGTEAHEMSESPEEEDAEQDEFHGLDMDEIHDKLAKLMKLKAKMEGRK